MTVEFNSEAQQLVSIRSPAWLRAIVYWCVPWLMFLAWKGRGEGDAIVALVLALAIVLICERYVFGIAIDLYLDRLTYQDRGVPWRRRRSIQRSAIRSFHHEHGMQAEGKPWEYLHIVHGQVGKVAEDDLTLVTFRRSDIARLMEWLSIDQQLFDG